MKEINKTKKNKGFTLIELLVVISIIAILVAATSSSFVNSQKKARDTSRKSELKSLSNALNMYYADKGKFPSSITFGGEFAEDNIVYMKKVPTGDASGTKSFYYEVVSPSQKSFRLYANLENNEDKDCIKNAGGVNLTTLNGVYTVSEKSCIYLLTSSNIGITGNLF